jgi:hypothetical protein
LPERCVGDPRLQYPTNYWLFHLDLQTLHPWWRSCEGCSLEYLLGLKRISISHWKTLRSAINWPSWNDLKKGPQIRNRDRLFWILLSRFWRGWLDALIVVKPDTVVRWHKKGFKLF